MQSQAWCTEMKVGKRSSRVPSDKVRKLLGPCETSSTMYSKGVCFSQLCTLKSLYTCRCEVLWYFMSADVMYIRTHSNGTRRILSIDLINVLHFFSHYRSPSPLQDHTASSFSNYGNGDSCQVGKTSEF